MRIRIKSVVLPAIVFIAGNGLIFATPSPQNVLIVYNANYTIDSDGDGVQDSLEVAQYYAAKRGVPAANILGVPCSVTDSYTSYQPFHDEMVVPIRNKLAALGPTNIDVILLCYFTPYVVPDNSGFHVNLDNALMGFGSMSDTSDQIGFNGNPYYDVAPSFDKSPGRFNHSSEKINGKDMYLVTRLDGPTVNAALEQVDGALYGERYISNQPGYYGGIGYVNSRYGFGANRYTDATLGADADVKSGDVYGYGTVDKCIAYTEHYITAAGFPLKWQNSTNVTLIGNANASYSDSPNTPALTAPNALFFGGWYVQEPDPFDLKAGSMYSDLYSFSMSGFRGGGSTSSKALLQGAACSIGAIFEPYLGGVSLPESFIYYMLNGYTFAEAATLANPAIGWMNIQIGDPLYAPLKQKTPVLDNQSPALVNGFPTVTLGTATTSRVINAMVKDTPEPDVVKVFVDYGTDTNYGTTVQSKKGYWRRHAITISGLQLNVTYHYRLRLQDPVGNVTTTGDYVFNTGTNQILTSIVVKPANVTIGVRTTQQFTATALDQLGNPIAPQPSFIWTADPNAGTMDRFRGVLTSSPTAGGPFTITATAGNVAGTTSITLVPQIMASLVLTPPIASVATNNSIKFKVTALDQFGNVMVPQPTFAWSVSGGGAIDYTGIFSAGNIAGGPFTVTAAAQGFAANAAVSVFAPVASSVVITPSGATVAINGTLQMTAVTYDQSGIPLNPQPALTWQESTSGNNGGSISQTGLFTAGSTAITDTIYVFEGSGFSVSGSVNIAVSSASILSFSVPAASVAENAGSITLSVRRQGSKIGAVSCNYTTSGGSANNYVPTSGTLNWVDGDTANKTISITIKDNNQGGPNPPFTVSLTNPVTGGAVRGTPLSEIVTVTDVDGLNLPGVIQFAAAAEGVTKAAGTVKLSVTRTAGSHGAVSINYQTSNATALAGTNYTTTQGTLNWADSDVATKTVSVPIINSASQQSDLSFFMTLSNPGGATLGSVTVATVTIVDGNGNPPPVITGGPTATPNPVTFPASTLLSVSASDPNGRALTYSWSSVSGPGTAAFNPNGTASANSCTATFGNAGSYSLRVTISDGLSSTTGDVTVTVNGNNQPPTVATPAAASPTSITGTTTNLSVLGADDNGESNLTYTWTATSLPSGAAAPTFSVNGTNAAKNTTATFSKAGAYTFQATIKDAGGLSVTSSVSVNVSATFTSIAVSPTTAVVLIGETQSFTATAKDQFSNPMANSFSWTVSGGGSISANGLFSAATVGGPFTVTASAGGRSATAKVTVSAVPVAPSIIKQPANQSVVTGQSGVFSVEATGTGVLTYKWRTNGSEITGATDATYTTGPTALSDDGTAYSVVVTNDAGSVTSNNAILTVTLTPPPNQPPVVNAGQDQTVSLSAGADLSGTVSDDGLPNPPGVVILTWAQVSGPGLCEFGNPNAAATHATFTTAGNYTLSLTASDGQLSSSANVSIVVNPDGGASAPSNSSSLEPAIENNPWVKGKSIGSIRFVNLSSDSTVKVLDRTGEIVKMLSGSGRIDWDVTDQSGREVPSGVYIPVINGKVSKNLKIDVVR